MSKARNDLRRAAMLVGVVAMLQLIPFSLLVAPLQLGYWTILHV